MNISGISQSCGLLVYYLLHLSRAFYMQRSFISSSRSKGWSLQALNL